MADQEPHPDPPQQEPSALSDADKIRAKRLAKLGGSSGSGSGTPRPAPIPGASSSPSPAQTPATAQSPAPGTPTKATPPATPGPAQNPFAQLKMAAENKPPPRINIKPRTASTHSTNNASQPAEFDIDAWADHTISAIFRLTVDPNHTRDVHGHKLYLAESVRSDLQDEGKPLRLTTAVLDQAILEAASSQTMGKPLEYLLTCWKRVSQLVRSTHNKQDPKYEILQEARRLCFNYCIFAATMPDMFGEDSAPISPLAEYLLANPESDRGLCHDFISEAVSRFPDPENGEEVKNALVGAMEQLSRQLAKLSMNDDFKPYILAMRNFVRYQPLLVALAESELFLPPGLQPQDIERKTLLGPFFRLSPMQAEVALNYFSNPTTRDKAYIANSQKALRMTLQTHQEELFDIANCFVKSSKSSREKMLDWFALTVNLNHKRRAIQVDPETVSTDGFMVNVTVVLDRLCEPFMDATFTKVDRIDIDYLRRSPRVDISDETKINADQHTSDEFYANKIDGTNNFITEIFFLTVAAHHYGTEAANTKLSSVEKEVKYLEKHLAKLEVERHKYVSNSASLTIFDNAVRKYKAQIETGYCTIHATRGVLLDDVVQARSMLFMRYVIVWLLRLVTGGNYPKQAVQLPLPQEQPMSWKCLPEYFIEDIVDNFKFITRFMGHIVTSTQCEELVAVCITFLRSSEYLKNPYLKSGLVTILFHGVWPLQYRPKGMLGDVLFAHKFATEHLLHALMNFYIECESTGAHTQFYDKFNIRYEIFQVIKCIWPNTIYRDNLATEARVNLDFFVQFVNLLLNDVTFVLDESFTAFTQIHEVSKLLKDPSSGLDGTRRQEEEEKLQSAQRNAKNYMQLTNETVAMLKLFTEALSDSFTKPEVVVRLAHMLDYNLDALVGPKKANLKVENPEEYGWNPRAMLAEITDVFLNLRRKQSFIQAVATDGRSYKPANFTAAYNILKRFALKSPEQLREWEQLAKDIQTTKEQADLEEADLGEIPEEYMDPILAELMEDPVMLPSSKNIVDRSTIRGHLLSDAHDPFNRVPLKIDEVIPQDKLREEIQAWKANKLAEKLRERQTAAAAGSQDGDPMDTS